MPVFSVSRGVSLCALACSLSAPALAEEAEQSRIIVTASPVVEEAAAKVVRTPGGVDVVSAGDFEDRLAISLRDALSFSPGVYTQPRFGQEVRISIRGSGLSRGYHMRGLTLLQDGIPINMADDNGDFQELDPQVFQHLEVYRGGNALRLGGSTLGGAINAVTPTGRTAPGVEMRVDGGSFDTLRAKAAYGHADARGDAWAAVTADRSDGDRDHGRRRALRFNGNVGLKLSERVETRFCASVQTIRQKLSGALNESDALDHPAKGNFTGDQARNIDSIRLQNRTTVALDGGELAFGVYYNAKALDHPIYQVVDQKSEDRGVFASLDLAGDLGGIPVGLTLGTQARFGQGRFRQFVNANGRAGAPTSYQKARAQTINSYGEARIAPLAGLWLIAGGIYTHGERRLDNRFAPARSGDASFDAFAPKFGLLVEPAQAVQFYANYSRSVELPGFIELGQTQFDTLAVGFVPLQPQKAWTAEVGTRGTLGIARWDIGIYRADLRGEMLQYGAGDSAIPAATFNAGRTRHQGVEAGLDLTLTPWATLRQVYQYSDFRFRGDAQFGNNRLPVAPRHFYRAELKLGTERLSISPAVEWLPQGAWVDYANTKRVGDYATLNLGAQAEVRKGLTLFLDARNLTGERAVGDISAVVDYSKLTPASRAIFYPIERRALYGGLRARF
ncbi:MULTISPECIES: TonB-dependent receptor family protein [Sphingobium]|uniref:TonB-dependent receptor n=1 Tax=Sphingobium fuliginis (strain ATCC 27551) TaxID=336203 RepID=A0ABQ1ETT4_SPHSA|nr:MULTISPECIES: TonB-dependent receptor [Sphingobium]AJR24607.1 ligand-gated channel protein [Sphingobium sp. YBL2]RYL99513.1 TonB-dependent receptor [Sphingobium fuliginis]WDA36664.1 TonB-dependent receptor [Sphingobium sp. YC-XJ3]GFZ85238.1 TonB-dependent receptor [Sphingobium fuliginis]